MMETDIGWRAGRGNSCLGAEKIAGPARALQEGRTIVRRPALSTISGLRMDHTGSTADCAEPAGESFPMLEKA